MFPEYKVITGGGKGYELNHFTVFDVPNNGYPFNIFDELGDFLIEGNNVPKFDDNRNIIDSIYSDYILVEYNNENIRNIDIETMNNRINITTPLRTEVIDGSKQLAKPVGNFELNGKYYLVLNPYNPFSNETNPELGIYKGVIVNPELYFGEIGKNIGKVKCDVDKLIK